MRAFEFQNSVEKFFVRSYTLKFTQFRGHLSVRSAGFVVLQLAEAVVQHVQGISLPFAALYKRLVCVRVCVCACVCAFAVT